MLNKCNHAGDHGDCEFVTPPHFLNSGENRVESWQTDRCENIRFAARDLSIESKREVQVFF
jgi:hypothetical protein